MKWRYQNLRLVLYRPVLLNLANRGMEGGTASQEDVTAVGKCRDIAKQTIEDIARDWTPNQMLGWHGVWFLYQASMIPLVSLFWESWNTPLVHECQAQIETVLEAFDGLLEWSLAARRSREVVSKMYEASKRPVTRQTSPRLTPVGATGAVGANGLAGGHSANGQTLGSYDVTPMEVVGEGTVLLDDQSIWDLDGMLWGNLPDGLDMPFDGMPSLEFEDPGAGAYDGNFVMHE